jgi:hypothetical protein
LFSRFSYAFPESGFVAVPGIGEHNALCNAGCYSLSELGQRNLWLGLEGEIVGNACMTRSFPVFNPFLGEVSPCALSHKSCLPVTTGSKVFPDGTGLMRVSRICWSVKAFSSAGIRLKLILSKAR